MTTKPRTTKPRTTKTKVSTAVAAITSRTLYAPDSQMGGTTLFAVTCANLHICGLYEDGATASKKAIIAPYQSDRMLGYHEGNGNFIKADKGRYALTARGKAYFASREDGSRATQQVSKDDIAKARDALTKGGTFGGIAFGRKLEIKI